MYERIDKMDGTRQNLTREELAARLAKVTSNVEEEIGVIDTGHVISDEFAWYQRTLVPGLRGTAEQNAAAEALVETEPEPEEQIVPYGNRYYVITRDGYDALSDFGAEVASREMTGDEAMYEVLRGEGADVEHPDHTPPNILGALLELRHEADYLTRRFYSGQFIPRNDAASDEMKVLEPRIRNALSAANVAIYQQRDAATPTPKVKKARDAKEGRIYERLKVAICSEVLRAGEELTGIGFYSRGCVERHGEPVNSIMVITYEDAPWFEELVSERLWATFRDFGFQYMIEGEELTLHPLGSSDGGAQ